MCQMLYIILIRTLCKLQQLLLCGSCYTSMCILSNIVSHCLCCPAVYAVYKHYCALRVKAKCGRTQRQRVIGLTLKGSLVCVRFAGSYAAADHLALSPMWVASQRSLGNACG